MKRKKRLEKGISSLEEQKRVHKEKKKIAEELGQVELVGYYEREIAKLDRERGKKKGKLER